jgi:uncharacterized DUF497 family protein
MMDMVFEWDPEKERENFRLHGVHFDAAQLVFFDPLCKERRDDDSSDDEERRQIIGLSKDVLFVVFTERGENTRIISARVAEPFERRIYYGNGETHGWQRVYP